MVKIRLVQRDGVLNQSFNFLILNDKAAMHLATFVSEMTSFIFFSLATYFPFHLPSPIASFQHLSFFSLSFFPSFSFTAMHSGGCE